MKSTKGLKAGECSEELARHGETAITGGVIRARGGNKRTLHYSALRDDTHADLDRSVGLYELDQHMDLRRVDDQQQLEWLDVNAAIPSRDSVVEFDQASILYLDDDGSRYRIPRHPHRRDEPSSLGWGRLDREVATERDLFHCHGTFYELPANNAGGFAKVRPVCSHALEIVDYCSYRGLFVMSGVKPTLEEASPHLIRSDDGETGLWVGAIDDIWQLGPPVGRGGPWLGTGVSAGETSDPYLMTGYHQKQLTLWHESSSEVEMEVQVDITGMGHWCVYETFIVPSRQKILHRFPVAFQAYWMRIVSSADAIVSAQLDYNLSVTD